VIIKSNFEKVFAFFVPVKFQKTRMISTDDQKTFYWLNKKLITATRTFNPTFLSNDKKLIDIVGLSIGLDRSKYDWVVLNKKLWPEIEDELLPFKMIFEDYYVAGGTDGFFSPI